MTANVTGLIKEGIAAFKAGRREDARKLLARATELDERNEEAWLWLSATVDSLENQQICLENVLAINPNNTRALKGLEAITKKLAKQPQVPPARRTPPRTPSSLSSLPPASSPPPSSPAQHVSPFDVSMPAPNFAAPPAESPGGYHGSGRHVDLPSEEEYDNWLDGLKLERSKQPSSDPFDIAGGPFQQAEGVSDPFADSNAAPAAPFGDRVSPGYEEEDEDDFAKGPRIDPFDLSGARSPAYPAYADDEEEIGGGTFVANPYASATGEGDFSSASPFGDYAEENVQAADDLVHYFDFIPADIEATYLPGQKPAYPRGVLIGLGVVGLGTIAALIVLVIQLLS